MRVNQQIREVERQIAALGWQDHKDYFVDAELRSKGETLLFQIMAMAACLVAWVIRPQSVDNPTQALVLLLLAMASGVWISSKTTSTVIGALGRIWFAVVCAEFFFVLTASSPNALFWHIAIASALVIAMSPLYFDPLSYAAAGTALLWALIAHHHGLIMPHPERHWMFAMLLVSFCFGTLINIQMFLAKTRIYRVNRRLVGMAFKDSLTQINNRRALMSDWAQLRAEDPLSAHCFMLIDADDFKSINDQHGHDVGDQVLQAMAQTIRDTEGVASCGRIGGEEFAVICRGTSTRGGQIAADIVRRVSGLIVQGVRFSVSVGLAPDAQTEPAIAAMKRADEALYEAKRQGKNGYCIQPKG